MDYIRHLFVTRKKRAKHFHKLILDKSHIDLTVLATKKVYSGVFNISIQTRFYRFLFESLPSRSMQFILLCLFLVPAKGTMTKALETANGLYTVNTTFNIRNIYHFY